MFGELDELAGNHGSQNKHSRYAVFGGDAIETESHCINDLTHKDTWDADIYSDQLPVHTPNPLLHSPVEAFNIWNVLVYDRCVQLNLHISERCLGRFKFAYISSDLLSRNSYLHSST